MKKKGFIGVASLFALAAFAVAPAVAQAEPHWYANGTVIKEAEVVTPVTTKSFITFIVKGEGKEYKTKCAIETSESITNPTGGAAGTDEYTTFKTTGCKVSKTATPPCGVGSVPEVITKVPMATKLAPGVKGRIIDNITVTSLEYKCSGTLLKTYTGTFSPKITNSKAKASGIIQFGGTTGGELKSGALSMTALGAANIVGPAGKEKITVRNP